MNPCPLAGFFVYSSLVCNFQYETPLGQIKENKMKNRKYFEIIGLLSVIGSLVFVGLEINQNTAAVRGATQQDISYQISEMYKIGVENDKIASIMSRSYQGLKKSELTDIEFLQFWLFSMLGYRRVENIYLQYKNGFLTEEAFDRIGMSFYRTPIQLEIWKERKEDFDPEFAEFFEELRDNK